MSFTETTPVEDTILLPGDCVAFGDSLSKYGFLQHVCSSLDSSHVSVSRNCVVLRHDGLQMPEVDLSVLRSLAPQDPDVSVQVVTFERPKHLAHALSLISMQDLPFDSFEVVVIDDSPTCTLEHDIFQSLSIDFVQKCLRYVHIDWGSKLPIGVKRNLATMLSRGRVIVHWDDDDYYGPSRLRIQSSPILAGRVDFTLVPLVWSFHTGDACGPDGFYYSDGTGGGHMCTMSYRKSLWSGEDHLRQYAESSLMEDLFFYRNQTGIFDATTQTMELGLIDFVYVHHGRSASAAPRVGRQVSLAPTFLPAITVEYLGWLRDDVRAVAPAQTIGDQVDQELHFLNKYFPPSAKEGHTVCIPRRYFMDLARMIPMIPQPQDRSVVVENLAAKLQNLNLSSLDGESFSMAAWCCSTLKLPLDNPLWAKVSKTLQEIANCLSVRNVSMLAYVAGRVGLKKDLPLLDALFERVRQLLDEVTPQDIVNLMSAMARLEVKNEILLSGLLQKYPLKVYSSEDWLRLTWSVSRLKPTWAEEKLFPRFIRTPQPMVDSIFEKLDALASSNGVQLQGNGEVPVLLVKRFATSAECRELRQLASKQGWERTENVVRKVNVAIFNRPGSADHPLTLDLRARAAKLVGLSQVHCESIHCVRYEDDERHDDHYDYVQEVDVRWSMDQSEPRIDSLLMGGQRHCTILLYMNSLSPGEGGETCFEHLGVRVLPEMGSALVWPNIGRDGHPDPRTKHASLPLNADEKFVANLWLRSEDIEHLRNVPSPARSRAQTSCQNSS